MDSIEEPEITPAINAKITASHCILLADMCLFMSAILDAHHHFLKTWSITCQEVSDKNSVKVWSTLGYTLRMLFTAFFFFSKIKNMWKMLVNTQKFPQIGAFYSPLMSTLLLVVIVYDFSSCSQISDIFSMNSAKSLISWYSILTIILVASLVLIYVILYLTKRSRKIKFILGLKISIGVLFAVGCIVGVVTNLEMIKKGHVFYFVAFDLYSFFVILGFYAYEVYMKCRGGNRNNVAPD